MHRYFICMIVFSPSFVLLLLLLFLLLHANCKCKNKKKNKNKKKTKQKTPVLNQKQTYLYCRNNLCGDVASCWSWQRSFLVLLLGLLLLLVRAQPIGSVDVIGGLYLGGRLRLRVQLIVGRNGVEGLLLLQLLLLLLLLLLELILIGILLFA